MLFPIWLVIKHHDEDEAEPLNHADIKTTMRYAHVLDEEVGDAVERLAKSRKKPRKTLRQVS
jgi:hypothetical protein